jgi:hypothetical protein
MHSTEWHAVAVLLQREKKRFDRAHHQFIDGMVALTARGIELSERQQKYLRELISRREAQIEFFRRVKRKIT